jgi:hypothetical protein
MRLLKGSHPRVVSWKRSSPEIGVIHPQVHGCGKRVQQRDRFAVAGLLKAALVAVSAVLRTEAMSKGVQGVVG